MGKSIITLNTEFICPVCKKLSSAEQIDAYTYSSSLSREQRRHIKSIVDVKNRPVKKKDMYYRCPECTNWSQVRDWKTHIDKAVEHSEIEDASTEAEFACEIEE